MIDSNKINHEVNYIKLLAVALSSDPVVMDKRLKDMCESQITEMFQEPDMYTDLFVLHKFILRNHEIDENVKRELIESIWRTDEEYNEIIDYAVDLGVENAFVQEGDTADESFIPDFSKFYGV